VVRCFVADHTAGLEADDHPSLVHVEAACTDYRIGFPVVVHPWVEVHTAEFAFGSCEAGELAVHMGVAFVLQNFARMKAEAAGTD
jgi:hypothetical protein